MSETGNEGGAAANPAADQTVGTDAPAAVESQQEAPPPETAPPAPAPAPVTTTTVLGLGLPEIVSLVGTLVGAVIAPGTLVAGFSIGQLTNLAMGVANAVPEAVTAFEEIKALVDSGQAPTAEQWASWNAAADAANASLNQAADAVEGDQQGHA